MSSTHYSSWYEIYIDSMKKEESMRINELKAAQAEKVSGESVKPTQQPNQQTVKTKDPNQDLTKPD